MAWSATHRYARIAERKVRLVADLIRGRRCDEAVEILKFTHKRAAGMVSRVLKSAMASANEKEATMNKLFVAEARVDGGGNGARRSRRAADSPERDGAGLDRLVDRRPGKVVSLSVSVQPRRHLG